MGRKDGAPSGSPTADDPALWRPTSVLIVEDNPSDRVLLIEHLLPLVRSLGGVPLLGLQLLQLGLFVSFPLFGLLLLQRDALLLLLLASLLGRLRFLRRFLLRELLFLLLPLLLVHLVLLEPRLRGCYLTIRRCFDLLG